MEWERVGTLIPRLDTKNITKRKPCKKNNTGIGHKVSSVPNDGAELVQHKSFVVERWHLNATHVSRGQVHILCAANLSILRRIERWAGVNCLEITLRRKSETNFLKTCRLIGNIMHHLPTKSSIVRPAENTRILSSHAHNNYSRGFTGTELQRRSWHRIARNSWTAKCALLGSTY